MRIPILHQLHTTRPPNVLFVNRAYPPAGDDSGVGLRDMAVNLVQRGWRVTVLTGSGDASDAFLSGGVRVVRVGADAEDGRLHRLAASMFFYPALLVRALFLGRFEIVVTKSDPPSLLILGWVLGFLLRARTVHWVDVLHPEAARARGRLPGPIAAVLRAISSVVLRRKDRVVAVGRCMKERLLRRGVRPERINVVASWPLHTLRPIEHRFNPFRAQHDLQGKFVVMHAGPLTQRVDVLLDAAGELHGAYPDVQFVITGDGPRRKAVAARIEADGLDNVRLLPAPQVSNAQIADAQPSHPRSNAQRVGGEASRSSGPPLHTTIAVSKGPSERLSAGDLHVVTMEEEACGVAVPAALYTAMAVGRPCLFLGPDESEAALFVREHGAGEAVSDGRGLALRIMGWYQSDVRRRIAGNRAYRAVRLSRANALIDFEDVLRGLLAEPAEEPIDAPVGRKALAA